MKAPLPGPGEAVRALRKRSGLTLTELASRTGLAVSTLSKLEMGHAYLKAADVPCRTITACSPRGRDETMKDTFVNASVRHADARAQPRRKPVVTRAKPAKK